MQALPLKEHMWSSIAHARPQLYTCVNACGYESTFRSDSVRKSLNAAHVSICSIKNIVLELRQEVLIIIIPELQAIEIRHTAILNFDRFSTDQQP